MADILEINEGNFESEVLQAGGVVLVDFWAQWCGPCRALMPTIEQLAKENSGVVKIGKVNTDENPRLAAKYDVYSIPTLLLFKNGEVVERFVGVQPKNRLQEALNRARETA